MEDLIARVSVLISASRHAVWTTLLLPDTITKITERTVVEGVVHRIEEEHLLEYEYGDPHSRDRLHRENVHRVTIALSDEGEATRVSITQDANIGRTAHKHA